MKLSEMRQKTDAELSTELRNITEGLFKLRFKRVTDVIEDPNQIRTMKKDIARIHTLLRERAMKAAKEKPAAKPAAPAAKPAPAAKSAPAAAAPPAAPKNK